MWEEIGYRVIGMGNGQMTRSYQIRLRRVAHGYPGYQYWLFSRVVGKPREMVRVPSIRCEKLWETARGLLLNFPAPGALVMGGGYHRELEFDSCDNYCKFRWRNDLPAEWSALAPVLEALEALHRRARFHLAPLSPDLEKLQGIIADGDDATWDRTAKTICAFHRKFGSWPTVLRVPDGGELMLELDFGERTLAMLRERLSLVRDSALEWSQYERIIAEDEAGNRAEYPVDVYGVEWITDEEFHAWIGVGPEQVADREAEKKRQELEEYQRAIGRDRGVKPLEGD